MKYEKSRVYMTKAEVKVLFRLYILSFHYLMSFISRDDNTVSNTSSAALWKE
jgi:hypothetical protein